MQAIDAEAALILASSVRAPRVYAWVQYPLIVDQTVNSYDFTKLGSQLVLNQFTAMRRINVLDTGADSLDLEMQGQVNDYTPLNSTSKYGRYFTPGAVDIKWQLWMGVIKDGAEVIWPKGVYVSEATNMDSQNMATKIQINCLDQFSLFRGDIYTSFPPRLYGGQRSNYYNPNFALTTNDHQHFICDAGWWMTDPNTFPMWASDFPNTASGDGSSLASGWGVYVSTNNNGMSVCSPSGGSGYSAFTVDTNKGTVSFTTPFTPSGGVYPTVSVDARPMAMRPELALYHLLVDFGDWDPAFLKIDQTGTMIPLTDLARDRAILDCAKDIITLVAPHGIRWSLYIDELGYIRFTELSPEGPAVRTLVDTKDILHITPEFSAADIYNVVRAQGTLQNNTPIESISYDIYSISTFGQKPTYDLPAQLTSAVKGMDVGSAASYLNGLTESVLFEYSRPSVLCDIEILADPTLQVGDPINIIESQTGINNRFYIKQISDEIQGGDWRQTCRIERQQMSQDWDWGLSANLGVGVTQNANAIQVQDGFLTDVSLENHGLSDTLHVVTNGQPRLDQAMQPVIFAWKGGRLDINITVGNFPAVTTGSGAFKAWIWRWIYIAEDAFNLSGILDGGGLYAGGSWTPGDPAAAADLHGFVTGLYTLPYDVRANVQSASARKFWWPLLRCSDWLTDDGVTAITGLTPVTGTQVFNSHWDNGPGVPSGNWTPYGNLIVGKNDFFGDTTTGFVGQSLYAAGTPAAAFLGETSTIKYGVDFGAPFAATPVYYGIKNVQTPCYLNILIATNAGTMQYKKIPFMLTV